MAQYVTRSGLKVDAALAAFIETEALPGTGIAADEIIIAGGVPAAEPGIVLAKGKRLVIDGADKVYRRIGKAVAVPFPGECICHIVTDDPQPGNSVVIIESDTVHVIHKHH